MNCIANSPHLSALSVGEGQLWTHFSCSLNLSVTAESTAQVQDVLGHRGK